MTTATVKKPKRRWSETVKNYWLDVALFFAFIIDSNVGLTGVAIHEWLGIAFAIGLIYHMMLHWKWMVATTKRLFGKLSAKQRVRYIIDLLLFIVMVVVVVTGLWISEAVLPMLNIPVQPTRFWFDIHHVSSELVVILVALHLALDWKWIVSNTKKYVLRSGK